MIENEWKIKIKNHSKNTEIIKSISIIIIQIDII